MRLLIQECLQASVEIDSQIVADIKRGEVVFVGFAVDDDKVTVERMVDKFLKLRIFPDSNDKTNLTIADVDGWILAISQFTLLADLSHGNRPSFIKAKNATESRALFEHFKNYLSEKYEKVKYGVFHADMKVNLINDGPFTLILDSSEVL